MARFASRTGSWSASPNRRTQALDGRRRGGGAVIDLTDSNPTGCGFTYPGDAIRAALSGPAALTYAPEPLGAPAAREALCEDYAARGVNLQPDRLILTAGTSEAYGHLFRLLADPGGRVLVPSPSYPLFELLAQIHDLTLVHYPLVEEERFAIDLRALEDLALEGASAILVVNPGNPTGEFLRSDQADALLALCARRGLPLLCDEVFGDYDWTTGPAAGASLAGREEALVFVLNGLSKMLALPQLKLAWIAASGPRTEVAEAMRRLEIIADTYLSVGTPVQTALPGLLALRASIQDQVLNRLRHNRETLEVVVSERGGGRCLPASGGWSSILAVPGDRSDEDWAVDLIEKDGVLVHPGYFFDFPCDGHIVLSLLPPVEVFRSGAEKLAARIAAG